MEIAMFLLRTLIIMIYILTFSTKCEAAEAPIVSISGSFTPYVNLAQNVSAGALNNSVASSTCGLLYCEVNVSRVSPTDTTGLEAMGLYRMIPDKEFPDIGLVGVLAFLDKSGQSEDTEGVSGEITKSRGHIRLELTLAQDCLTPQFYCIATLADVKRKVTLLHTVIGGQNVSKAPIVSISGSFTPHVNLAQNVSAGALNNSVASSTCGLLYCEVNVSRVSPTDTATLHVISLFRRIPNKEFPETEQLDVLAFLDKPGHSKNTEGVSGEVTESRGHIRLELTLAQDCLTPQFYCIATLADVKRKVTFLHTKISGQNVSSQWLFDNNLLYHSKSKGSSAAEAPIASMSGSFTPHVNLAQNVSAGALNNSVASSTCGLLYCEVNVSRVSQNDTSTLIGMGLFRGIPNKEFPETEQLDHLASLDKPGHSKNTEGVSGEVTESRGHIRLELTLAQDCLTPQFYCLAELKNVKRMGTLVKTKISGQNVSRTNEILISAPGSAKTGSSAAEAPIVSISGSFTPHVNLTQNASAGALNNSVASSTCGLLYCEVNVSRVSPNDTSTLIGMGFFRRIPNKEFPETEQLDPLASLPNPARDAEGVSGEVTDLRGHIRLELTLAQDCLTPQFYCKAILADDKKKVTSVQTKISGQNVSRTNEILMSAPGSAKTGQVAALSGGKGQQAEDESQLVESLVLEKLRCLESRLSDLLTRDSRLEDKVERLRYSVADKISSLERNVADKIQFTDARINDKIDKLRDRIDDRLSIGAGAHVSCQNQTFACDVCRDIQSLGRNVRSRDLAHLSSLDARFGGVESAVTRSESAINGLGDKLDSFASGMNHVTNMGQTLVRSADALKNICLKDGSGQEPAEQYLDALGTGEKVWRLAFRGTAHNNVRIYPAYLYGTGIPAEVEPGCKQISPNHTLPCINHYRNHQALDHWVDVDRVLFAVYVKGRMVEHVVFNGRGSTFTSWFEANRVLESSWTDLKTLSHNFFSIEGDSSPHLEWRFLINHKYGSCAQNAGWFLAGDIAPGYCKWETKLALPAFFYAKDTTSATSESDSVARADAIGVFLKYK